jgi:formate dehydrogenase iron-sulfur subunit
MTEKEPMMRKVPKGLLIDVTRCLGCRLCMEACSEAHGIIESDLEAEVLSASNLTVIQEVGDLSVRRLCMHCLEPSCASACPVSALSKREDGPVVYDASRCLGCRYCMVACPFSVPRYQWSKAVPAVAKCDLCASRLDQGELPACVEACPAEAVVFGARDELLAEAHRRIAESPADYYPEVYGESEAGGTSVLILSPVPFAEIGLRTDLANEPLPNLTAAALHRVPGIASVGGAALWAIWWITNRRDEVARAEGKIPPPRGATPGEENDHA